MSYDDMAAKRDVIALNNLNAGMRLIDEARLNSLSKGQDNWEIWMAVWSAAFWERINLRNKVAAWSAPWFEVKA